MSGQGHDITGREGGGGSEDMSGESLGVEQECRVTSGQSWQLDIPVRPEPYCQFVVS